MAHTAIILCDHPFLQREQLSGVQTGEFVCLSCGKMGLKTAWVRRDRRDNRQARKTHAATL